MKSAFWPALVICLLLMGVVWIRETIKEVRAKARKEQIKSLYERVDMLYELMVDEVETEFNNDLATMRTTAEATYGNFVRIHWARRDNPLSVLMLEGLAETLTDQVAERKVLKQDALNEAVRWKFKMKKQIEKSTQLKRIEALLDECATTLNI